MTPGRLPARSLPRTWRDPEELLIHFEKAWQDGPPPAIEEYVRLLAPAGQETPETRHWLLAELVMIDLQYRWRANGPGLPPGEGGSLRMRPGLDDYLERYPELGPRDHVTVELIGEEYRVRRASGDRPDPAEYDRRFPRHGAPLRDALQLIDTELAMELTDDREAAAAPRHAVPPPLPGTNPASPIPIPSAVPPSTVAELLDVLGRLRILSPWQLAELTAGGASQFRSPHDLGRALAERKWLTDYQVNKVLEGQGPQLALGPYLLLELLGEGGVGQVFKARHRETGQVVALKVIRPELVGDAEVFGRFYREIRIVGQLAHPNIVRAYDASPIGATHVLAMEFVEGIDLARLVKQAGPLPVAQACEYVRQAALGLQHGHERGLVHRDLKPSNLLLSVVRGSSSVDQPSPSGRGSGKEGNKLGHPSHGQRTTDNGPIIKILDLGLARLRRSKEGETPTLITPQGAVLGTPDYLAPEQAIDFHQADIRADVYSLGCTLFWLLTGQPPFPGGTIGEKMARHLHAAPPAIEQFRSDIPPALTVILRRTLAKRPEDRYQTPRELGEALAPLAAAVSLPGRLPELTVSLTGPALAPTVVTARPRRRLLRVVGLLLLLGMGSLLVHRALRGPGSQGPRPALPARVLEGRWTMKAQIEDKNTQVRLEFQFDGKEWRGVLSPRAGESYDIQKVRLDGARIFFECDAEGILSFYGEIWDADNGSGTLEVLKKEGGIAEGTWTMSRRQ